jgi:hypothetical protein
MQVDRPIYKWASYPCQSRKINLLNRIIQTYFKLNKIVTSSAYYHFLCKSRKENSKTMGQSVMSTIVVLTTLFTKADLWISGLYCQMSFCIMYWHFSLLWKKNVCVGTWVLVCMNLWVYMYILIPFGSQGLVKLNTDN